MVDLYRMTSMTITVTRRAFTDAVGSSMVMKIRSDMLRAVSAASHRICFLNCVPIQ